MVKCGIKRREFTKYMAKHNKSQNDLAIILGVTSGHISQLLRGVRNPGPEMREKIMYEFGEKDWDKLFKIL
jgi:transcriptional regulator with XRE-family HTH domain